MKGYFNENSEIKYESNVLKFHYRYDDFTISWKDRFDYKRSKTSYIPSQRNLSVLPEMEKVDLPNNNLKSFLFDWFDARKLYPKDKTLALLDIDVKYYYSDDSKESHIIKNDNTYDISLANASSGLQSIAPLVVMIDYLTKIFYENKQESSYEMDKAKEEVIRMLMHELLLKPIYGEDVDDVEHKFKEIGDKIDEGDIFIVSVFKKYSKVRDNLFKIHSTNLVIEEPEQNLFPSTQKALIYYLLESINKGRNHNLILTTHSQYVLYAINNCIMAYLVSDELNDKEKEKLNCLDSRIDPKSISIYQIEDGYIERIQEEDGLIKENFFDEQMKEVMDEFYVMLNHL